MLRAGANDELLADNRPGQAARFIPVRRAAHTIRIDPAGHRPQE